MDEKERLLQIIAALEAQLNELKARLPAHSIPPTMILELDQLDEQLSLARQKLSQLTETQG